MLVCFLTFCPPENYTLQAKFLCLLWLSVFAVAVCGSCVLAVAVSLL